MVRFLSKKLIPLPSHNTVMQNKPVRIILLIALLLILALPAMAVIPPGRITVYSNPSGAHVCIDSKTCDIAPATFPVDGNEWHMIVVTETGYRDWVDTVYVTSDLTSTVTAYLDQDPAATAIHVNVTPGGGTVCLDNTQCRSDVGTVGSTGSTLYTGVSPGYHTISIESPPGYLDTMKLVQVNLGKITEVNITLDVVVATPAATKIPSDATGMVRVYVNRIGSTVCLDNARCVYNTGGNSGPGTGTTFFDNVRVNETHIVTVAADGYEPYSALVFVDKDLIARVDVSLVPVTGTTVTTVPPTVPATAPPVVTTVTMITGASSPVRPVQTKSPLDAVPVLGAVVVCGAVFLIRKNRE
jgi:hypothetical protein